jgi:ABC-type transport system involved in cytochrome c biogenesis permease subunit
MTRDNDSKQLGVWKTVVIAAITAIGAALITNYAQNGQINLMPANMSYADLAAILLSAVGVIVAIFGGLLAIAAFWGFEQMKRDAVRGATQAALQELKERIENGPTKDYITSAIERLILDEFNSRRMDQRIKERVDKIAMGGSEDRLLDEEAEGDRS